jgi:hypothetical protein
MTRRVVKPKPLIGWREWVVLTELAPTPLKAKIDTGARTSTLHAFDLSIEMRDAQAWATFEIHPIQRSRLHSLRVSCKVKSFKQVRSSMGHTETRPVITTPLRIGPSTFDIDVTLTARDAMGFRMLIGRAAVRRRFWVDPGRSFVHGVPEANQ